jgi:glycosyltransferase involved in cell wall biosynthesis
VNRLGILVGTFPALTETFIAEEILALRRRGFDIAIFALQRGPDAVMHASSRALAEEVHYTGAAWSPAVLAANVAALAAAPGRYLRALGLLVRGSWRNPVHLLKALYLFPKSVELGQRMIEEGVGHLHAHWTTYPATMAMIASEALGLPYSLTAHPGDVSLFRTLLAEKVRRARFVLTCTDDLRADLARLVGPEAADKVVLNYHGVSIERFAVVARPERPAEPVIMACGALYERKGFADLVRACAILRHRGHRFRCVIIGDGPQRAALASLVAEQRLSDCVELTGALAHADVAAHYAQSHIFALPCFPRQLRLIDGEAGVVKSIEALFEPDGGVVQDGIPNVLVEAMATGLPVVTTPISGIPELVRHGETGLLVPPRDPRRLADALGHLLEDGALAARLGAHAADDVRTRFDRATNIGALATIFAEHIGGVPAAAPAHSTAKVTA